MFSGKLPAERRHSRDARRHSLGLRPGSGVGALAWLLFGLLLGVAVAGCDGGDDSARTGSPPGDPPVVDDPPHDIPDPPQDNPARLTAVVPAHASGAGGTLIAIATSGFSADFTASLPAVTFGAFAAANVAALDATRLVAEVPAMAAGEVEVAVTGPAYTAAFAGFAVVPAAAPGEVSINEVLPNPGGLDANRDGAASNVADEFVELVNLRASPVDLSGFALSDAVALRHTFPNPTTVPAGGAVVVFAAGDPGAAGSGFGTAHASGHAQAAASGALSLNNGGDTVILTDRDVAVIDTLDFGAATAGISLNRDPDGGRGGLLAHSSLSMGLPDAATGGEFSPGLRADQSAW